MSKATLTEIDIREGNIRGLTDFHIKFDYPISIIAGKNGSGKSTVLALAACAYHNSKNGFKLPERKTTYYTYSEFFFQTSEEVPREGIEVWYRFRNNKWKRSKRSPKPSWQFEYRLCPGAYQPDAHFSAPASDWGRETPDAGGQTRNTSVSARSSPAGGQPVLVTLGVTDVNPHVASFNIAGFQPDPFSKPQAQRIGGEKKYPVTQLAGGADQLPDLLFSGRTLGCSPAKFKH